MSKSYQRVSLKDLAAQAGVSVPTVSRALHGRGRVAEDTRQQILQLAQELGYTPSLVARGLVTRRTLSVGLVVTTFADPFHNEVAQGVEEEARRHSYSIFLASTGVDPQRELEVVRTFQGRRVDGIIVSSSRVGNRYAELLQETGIPLVLINTHVASDHISSISHDDYAGGCLLMRHLLDRGYRRIAYAGNERGVRTNAERRRAWEDTLAAAGLAPLLWAEGPNGRLEGGAIAGEQLLQRARRSSAPDAIYCYNDTMAIGVMSVLRRYRLRIPGDVALTGFDDIDVAGYLDPPLTTLRQPRRRMGVEAMKMLLKLIQPENDDKNLHELPLENRPITPQQILMQGELVVRDST
jgi:DNA-binding LacI/PurR family transcriptional regulator